LDSRERRKSVSAHNVWFLRLKSNRKYWFDSKDETIREWGVGRERESKGEKGENRNYILAMMKPLLFSVGLIGGLSDR
jgi:hypothetical protein